jgi:hypothetical protein
MPRQLRRHRRNVRRNVQWKCPFSHHLKVAFSCLHGARWHQCYLALHPIWPTLQILSLSKMRFVRFNLLGTSKVAFSCLHGSSQQIRAWAHARVVRRGRPVRRNVGETHVMAQYFASTHRALFGRKTKHPFLAAALECRLASSKKHVVEHAIRAWSLHAHASCRREVLLCHPCSVCCS